jgi:pectate disaccharide-lyase
MRIYLDSNSMYTVSAAKLDTYVSAGTGTHYLVVQAWDSTGAVFKNAQTVTVGGASSTTTGAGVAVSSPAGGATVSSPVQFAAAAASGSGLPITAMRVYVDNADVYTTSGSRVSTSLPIASGSHYAVVQAWDSAGKVYQHALNFAVNGSAGVAGGVAVSSPANGATVSSPVRVTAAATANSGKSITAMRVYVDSASAYTASTNQMSTSLSMSSGTHSVVVQAWDNTGAVYKKALSVNVAGAPANPPAPTPAPSPAPIRTGNVYYVAPNGGNGGGCGSSSSPCATPEYAFDQRAGAGDTVVVEPGTYAYGSTALQLSSSGAAGKYKTITCATRGACKIVNGATGNSAVIILSGSYVTFDGFEVTNNGSGNNLGFYLTASYQNITRNTIHHIETDCGSNGGGGIQVAGSGSFNSDLHDYTIDSNLIYDISWQSCQGSRSVQTDGILVETAGTNIRVTNNVVYHAAGGWGILVGNSNATSASVNTVIANNTVFSNGNGGIILMSGNGSTIANNIVLNNGLINAQCGINAPSGVSVTYANNLLYGNAGGNYCLEWGSGNASVHANDLAVNPASGTLFVNWQADGSGNYHLKSGSPAINTGASVPNVPAHDFDGTPRSGWDIGAYE